MASRVRRFVLISVLALTTLLVLSGSGCVASMNRLAHGDIIDVTVEGESGLTSSYEVDSEGKIAVPMVGQVPVGDCTTAEAAARITQALSAVLVKPRVTVAYKGQAPMQVFVVGQVSKPGPVEVGIGDKIIQALAKAGYDETADLARVSLCRGDDVTELDLTRFLSGEDIVVNRRLEPGDTLIVPKANVLGAVMVLGQATKVGSFPLQKNMTFREFMGLIGGVTVEADTEDVTVKREGLPDPIEIDYAKAMDGDPTQDIVLQPNDTIYIPQIETSFFTIIGGVNRPGQYPLKGKLTISEAIGLAGGPQPNVGDMRKVQLVRAGDEGLPGESIELNLAAMMKTADPEPLIQRGDVINVALYKQKSNVWDIFRTLLPFGWIFR